jgi:XTP/dITP diphosphohydrolase
LILRKLVFATNNPHKLGEVRTILQDYAEVVGLRDIGCYNEIPENGETLEENAAIKARYVQCTFGLDCFADDTGLEIDTLGGKPGVRSARYAGEDCNASNNIVKILEELSGESNRKARFRTVICLIEDGAEKYFEGSVEGRIIDEKRGNEGFGYDPVFVPNGYATTFAEMTPEEKNRISHRGRAIAALMAWLTRPGSPK